METRVVDRYDFGEYITVRDKKTGKKLYLERWRKETVKGKDGKTRSRYVLIKYRIPEVNV